RPRRAGRWFGPGARANSGFEPVRIHNHGWTVRRPNARNGGAIFVLAFNPGGRREWSAGAERSDCEAAPRKLRLAGDSHDRFGHRRVRVDLVPAAISTDTFDGFVYSLSSDRGGIDPGGVVRRICFSKYLTRRAMGMDQRDQRPRSPRIPVEFAVEVEGTDHEGKPFQTKATA